jgi:hypothetical protein
MRLKRVLLASLLLGVSAASAYAQSGVSAPCARAEVPSSARDYCYTVAQAVESGQPQFGILIAGGNPTIGTASGGGLRLGVLPRVSASANVNVVFIELPEILAEQAGSAAQRINDVVGIPAPALSGTVAVGVFPGFSAIPTVGGIGSIDLLGSVTWLPFNQASVEGFESGTKNLAYGVGARVGIVRESFLTPGVSVSVMRRSLGRIEYGDVCPGLAVTTTDAESFTAGNCTASGDAGEFSVDLTDWSGRAAVGKRLLGLGLTAGLGYDRFSSDIGYGFRAPSGTVAGTTNYFARASGIDLDSDRWSAFLDASFTLLVATIGAEAGWLQGSDPIQGFPSASDFDPGNGTFFGSVGVRLSL